MHNRVTELNGIRWQYDIHGRTTEKDDGQTRWRYRYDGEHRLTDAISEPRDRIKPRNKVSFRYDPLGRRISKTCQQSLQGKPSGHTVSMRFVWESYRLLQKIHDDIPLTYVYSDSQSYEPLARIDGVESPEIFWFHCAANGTPELLTDVEGQKTWEGVNGPWGKLLRESNQRIPVVEQNLRMQGQYLDRETGLHCNLFRYYDPDTGQFTQHDPIGLAGGINLYQYAPNALGWVDPWGLTGKDVTTFYHAGDIKGPTDPSFGQGNKDFDPADKGGFYVTTDRAQAEKWAQMRTDRNMSITQFDVPNTELAKLDIKVFDSANSEWADFVAQARKGTLSHGHDAVSGPMLLNLRDFKRGRPPKAGGTQFAIYSQKAAELFNKFKRGCN